MTNTGPHDLARKPQASLATIVGVSVVSGLVLGVSALLITASVLRQDAPQHGAAASASQAAPDPAMRVATAAVAPLPTTSGAADPAPAARDDAACDRQAWPYVTSECRQRNSDAAVRASRQVRVVTTDGKTSIISSPVPVIEPKTAAVASAKTPPVQQRAAMATTPAQQAPTTAGTVAPPVAYVQPAVAPVPSANLAPAPVYASASAEDEERASSKPRSERKARRAARRDEERAGKMVVRTIEFPDGRRVTITHPIGKGGVSPAMAAVERASERAAERQSSSPPRGERVSAEAYGYVAED